MSLDFEVRRPTRQCALGGRALTPGEPFYSILVEQNDEVVRKDIAASAWNGPPHGAIGWWRTRMPGGLEKPEAAPRNVLLGLLDQWANDPAEAPTRYLLALLLVRRRVLRIEQEGFAAGLAGGNHTREPNTLRLNCADRDDPIVVPIVTPTPEQTAGIESRLCELLGIQSKNKKAA